MKPDLATQAFLFVVAVCFWDLSLVLNLEWGPPRVPTGGTLTSLKSYAERNRQAGSYWKGGKGFSLSSVCSGCQSAPSTRKVSVPRLSQYIICLLCSHIETCHWSFVLAIASFPRRASLCLPFSMSPPPRCGKAWGTMVEFGEQSVSLWCADKRIQCSRMTESSSACPLTKRKWLDPSLKDVFSPLQWVLWTIQTMGHFPILFWVKAVTSSLCWFTWRYHSAITTLGLRRHLKCPNQAPTFQDWLVSNGNTLIRDRLSRERCLAL